ncbi:uncharacterized protein C24B11.05-like isoform X2 [Impatiens glandulifera]|uniref:uncharacterized protein C24B11.05-like isoform X2 n=1 Tax=Impatiens glandulifera TaxID=253017 RepID=UPI001FB18576|nr:uncharacterized protein C24B11.05-like isoform X2 [Impatiens glandulifera]
MESINSEGAKYECLLFDMDDTLYPLSTGLNFACRLNIQDYMRQYLHIEESCVPKMCVDLYKEHGTTMAGLKALGYQFNNDEFHEYVHGKLPYDVLKTDHLLRTLLLSIPHRKIVFTNADRAHVDQALKKLGLEDCFEDIICFETLNPCSQIDDHINGDNSNPSILCKPSLKAFSDAIRIAKIDPNKTIFFDDSTRNIASAKLAGLHTVIKWAN